MKAYGAAALLLFGRDSDILQLPCSPSGVRVERVDTPGEERLMGSKYPPGFYSEKTLLTVEEVFREVWNTLEENDPQVANNSGLRIAVIDRLLTLLEEGVRDPDELRTLTLGHFNAEPRA